jgi:hypothetical protein
VQKAVGTIFGADGTRICERVIVLYDVGPAAGR